MEENINIFALVLDELNKNDMWFTTKADPTAEEASSYYKLDEYGEPTEATVKKIEKEVTSLIGDGAVDIYDAVELWVNDALVAFKIDYKDNLVTQFEDKPVVDNIEAYENPVQFPQSKKVEGKQLAYISELQKDTLLKVDEMCNKGMSFTDVWYELQKDGYDLKCYNRNHKRGSDMPTRGMLYKDGEFSFVTIINGRNGKCSWETEGPTYYTEAKTKKTEGAGAGYEIRGIVSSAKVNNYEVIGSTTNQYNEKIYELKCDIDVKLEDVQFESYYYGGKIDFPIDGKVTYLIVSENSNNDIEEVLTNSDIENALDGAKIKEMLGGGWVHETFTGDFSGEFDGDVYGDYYALDFEMTLTQEPVIDFIDKKVDGVMDEVTYCVYDKDNDPIDDFSDEDEAVEFAKKNGYVEVVEKYHDYQLIDADGSIDDNSYEDGDIVWERDYTKQYKFDDEVEESKEVKTETYKPTEDEWVGKMKDTNGTFFDVYQHGDKFLDVLGNELSKEEVAEYVKKYTKTEAKELKFKVNDIVEDKTGVGKIMEIDPEHPEGLIYGVQFSNVDLPNDKDDIGLWWCKEGDISLVTDKVKIDKYNKWFNTEYNKLESKKAERKKKQIEAFKNRKVNFNKRTKEENYQRRLDEVNNKSKNLISDLFSSNDFDSDSPAGQIIMRTSEMFNALSDKGYDVEVTFDNGESTSAIQLGQQGGKVMITITNTNQPLRAFTSGNFEITDENIKILQDIQNQIEVL